MALDGVNMDCNYKKFIICTDKCKWFSKEGCLLATIEDKMETALSISEFQNAIDSDNMPIINNCIYCNATLSGKTNIFKRSEGIYQVFCANCHLRGPRGATVAETVTNYNNLPTNYGIEKE